MIARHEAHMDKTDIWSKLAASLPAGVISCVLRAVQPFGSRIRPRSLSSEPVSRVRRMRADDGHTFDANIPPFTLSVPRTLH